MDVFIKKKEDFDDFIVGLDMIKKFRLIQNENIQIVQGNNADINKSKNRIEKYSKNKENDDEKTEIYSINFNENI